MIHVHISHGVPFVWNAKDACTLREEYRICGELVGCHPRLRRQSDQLSLPLRLMPEEATLMVEKGVCKLLDNSTAVQMPTPAEVKRFQDIRESLYQEQVTACKEKRKKEIVLMMDKIREGRKAKKRKMKEAEKMEAMKEEQSKQPTCINEGDKCKVRTCDTKDVSERCVYTANVCNQKMAGSGDVLLDGDNIASEVVCQGINDPSKTCDRIMDQSESPSGVIDESKSSTAVLGHSKSSKDGVDQSQSSRHASKHSKSSTDVMDQSESSRGTFDQSQSSGGLIDQSESFSGVMDQSESFKDVLGQLELSKGVLVPSESCEDMMDQSETPWKSTSNKSESSKVVMIQSESPKSVLDYESEEEKELNPDDIHINPLSRKHAMVQITTSRVFREVPETPAIWTFPETAAEKLRYKTFKGLWEQVLYITAGQKFGGDFLVYPDDPLRYHAFYIAICLLPDEPITSLDLSTMGRLSTKVKKTTVLCSYDDSGEICYTSLQWAAIT